MKELNKFTNADGMTIVLLFEESTGVSHVVIEQTRKQVFSYYNLDTARLRFLRAVTANII